MARPRIHTHISTMTTASVLGYRVALATPLGGAQAGRKSANSRVTRGPLRCVAEEAAPTAAATSGTPVRKTAMLVIGATGTLGRQVVRRALDEGYDVRCLVRPRQNPADFLRDWGATTVSGDLTKPETLPAAFVGIHTVIDASTARPEEDTLAIDWKAKVDCIQTAAAMGIQRYVFFSIDKCEQHKEVPLMNMKYAVEEYLKASGMNYTVLRLCGFMQPLISGYAVPILEEQQVWGTDDDTRTAYLVRVVFPKSRHCLLPLRDYLLPLVEYTSHKRKLLHTSHVDCLPIQFTHTRRFKTDLFLFQSQDTQDVAKMTLAACRRDEAANQVMTLAGPKAYSVNEVISLCEKLGGAEANVSKVPVLLLKATRGVTRFFQWTAPAADRLAFAEGTQKGFSKSRHTVCCTSLQYYQQISTRGSFKYITSALLLPLVDYGTYNTTVHPHSPTRD